MRRKPIATPVVGLHYMLEAFYTEPAVEGTEPEVFHIEVSFLVQENLSPRPIYQSKDSAARVTLLYPKHRYGKSTAEYFILDYFIVDPDGVSSLRPHRLTIKGGEEGNYKISRATQTEEKETGEKGMFLLKIKDSGLVAPQPSQTEKSVMEETITLIASDEVHNSEIQVVIQKWTTQRW